MRLDSIEAGLKGNGTWLGVRYEPIHQSIHPSIHQPIEAKQIVLEPRILFCSGRGGTGIVSMHAC